MRRESVYSLGMMGWGSRQLAIAALPLLFAASLPASCGSGSSRPGDAGTTQPPQTAGSSVGYQIDLAHSGNQPLSTFRPPLTRQWAVYSES